ncbi:MAG: M15 family metallopeptidase [Bacteroides sp.]|nr:M15 family metallopeptidase [Bacteroides sp.]MCM1420396.1 M15 family metallopeptidase [Bacteroides sp.]
MYLSAQQPSQTAQSMKAQGYVDVTDYDSTLHVSLMYSRPDNFTGKILYTDLKEAYLHPLAAEALAKAQRELKKRHPKWSLIIYDAARPMSIQQKMWDVVKGTSKNIYVSNPANGGGLHNYGFAVDISICDENGDSIPMGTPVDYMGRAAHPEFEEEMLRNGTLTQVAADNRRLLRSVMAAGGFKVLKTEWWHFNLKTRKQVREEGRKPIR